MNKNVDKLIYVMYYEFDNFDDLYECRPCVRHGTTFQIFDCIVKFYRLNNEQITFWVNGENHTKEEAEEIKEEENAEVLEVIQPEVKEPKKVLAPFVAVGKAFKKAVDGGVKTINKVSDDINAASKSKDIEDQQYTCLILLFYLDALASFLGLNEEQ